MVISTGIDLLDRLLAGGIKKGASALIMSTPGVEDLQFAHQCLFAHLNNKGHAVYVVNNKKPSILKATLKEFDWDVSPFEKKGSCIFLDCYSGLLSMKSQEKDYVSNPTSIAETSEAVFRLLKKVKKPSLLVFDSLSSLIDLTNAEEDVLSFLKRLKSQLKESNTTMIALFTRWPYSKTTIDSIEELFDCVIRLKAIEQKVILRSYFSVAKAKWLAQLEKKEIPYKIVSPGGVKVFIPKILVTGPFNAGKSSFIHSASTRAVSVDRLGTTVALDHGHVDFRGFAVDLFGTPGQERFDPILEMLGGEALGVIVVVDSTDPKGFARAKEMLELTKTEGLPAVIVANKADLEGALSSSKIRERMKLPEETPIIPVVAEDIKKVRKNKPCKLNPEDIGKVFEKLFETIV
ncbi:MAG: GTP-binding protein [Nanoarchaeota archaeon]|nr:GTP-binding protein [Nanoarchaeota archaeon]